MITIKNTQRTVKINLQDINDCVQKVLYRIGYPDFDIGIWFTNNRTIKSYNERYRRKNKPTDILSFAYHPNSNPDKKIVTQTLEDKNLGDIIVSAEYVKKSAAELKIPFQEHLNTVLIHGVCHLLGYTHDTEKNHARMQAKEKELAKIVSKLS